MDEETRDYLIQLEARIDLQFHLLNDAVEQRDRFLHGELFAALGLGLGALGAWLIQKALDWMGFHDGFWAGALFWIILLASGAAASRFLTRAQRENEGRLEKLPEWRTQVPHRGP